MRKNSDKSNRRDRKMSEFEAPKKIVLEGAKKFFKEGLTVGPSGNVSLRTSKKATTMAITRSGKKYEEMTTDDVIIVDFSSEDNKIAVKEGKFTPSSESILHSMVYKNRKNINAVVHYHGPYSTTIGLVLEELPAILDDQVFFLGGAIGVTKDYAVSGSIEMANQVIPALGKKNAVIIRNHGAIGIGKNMEYALEACHYLEKAAQIYIWASCLGGKLKLMSEEAIKYGLNVFNAMRGG
jgi:L-fuculose-phosphate aldolase